MAEELESLLEFFLVGFPFLITLSLPIISDGEVSFEIVLSTFCSTFFTLIYEDVINSSKSESICDGFDNYVTFSCLFIITEGFSAFFIYFNSYPLCWITSWLKLWLMLWFTLSALGTSQKFEESKKDLLYWFLDSIFRVSYFISASLILIGLFSVTSILLSFFT